ncbi:MAG: twin-arginine translocase TatA/TatE family subunit [Bacteroidales bacterium]|nr:twin-arginine translocase TatA/TatE family subunit [Bacteroidales bacterium]
MITALYIMPLTLGTWEIVAIVLVVLLLFGGKKIPELMRGLGKGVKEFKGGMKEAEKEFDDIKKDVMSDDTKK